MTEATPAAAPRRSRRWLGFVVSAVLMIVGIVLATAPRTLPLQTTAGRVLHRNEKLLPVTGTPVATATVWVRLQNPTAFNTVTITLLLDKRAGAGWTSVTTVSETVDPTENILAAPLHLTAGQWRVVWMAGSTVLAQQTFTVAP